MTTRSVISAQELNRQVTQGFVDQSFEIILIDAPDVVYDPAVTVDSEFLANAVPPGTFGYEPQVIRFEASDITQYSDGGIGLVTKTAVFDNNAQGSYQFTHVCMKRGVGNAVTVSAASAKPSEGITSTVLQLPTINVDTSLNSDGLTVDVTVFNDGANFADWVVTIANPGFGYVPDQIVAVTEDTLAQAGAATALSTGNLVFKVETVNVSDGSIVSVTPAENTVVMSDGNEAVFYYNLKQFGYASQL